MRRHRPDEEDVIGHVRGRSGDAGIHTRRGSAVVRDGADRNELSAGFGSLQKVERRLHDPEGSLPVVDNEGDAVVAGHGVHAVGGWLRSEEHTSELQSLMRISYAVFCLKKKKKREHNNTSTHTKE